MIKEGVYEGQCGVSLGIALGSRRQLEVHVVLIDAITKKAILKKQLIDKDQVVLVGDLKNQNESLKDRLRQIHKLSE